MIEGVESVHASSYEKLAIHANPQSHYRGIMQGFAEILPVPPT